MGNETSLPLPLTASASSRTYQAVVAGSTGASGRAVVGELLKDPKCVRVVALTRTVPSEKVDTSEKLIFSDFAEFPKSGDFIANVPTVAVVAMGTAPWTEEADVTAPTAFGRKAADFGVVKCALVSAVGASTGSMFGYVDAMGRREQAFQEIKFLEGLVIFRPKFLLRQEKMRTKEKFFEKISPDSQCIDTRDMAKVIVASLSADVGGVFVVEHREMKKYLGQ